MSFARKLVEDAIRDFAIEAQDISWIFADQGVDRPERPYGTIKVTSSVSLGMGDVELESSGDQVIERLREVFEIDVSIQAFGRSAMDIAQAVKTHAKRPSTVIGSAGGVLLGFMSAGGVRDLAEVVSAGWEGRAQCDFRFSARFDCDLTLDTIRRVDISGAEGTHTTMQTVEIPEP